GFSRVKSSLFVISSHLYEIANEFKYPEDISCKYLETILEGDEFHFTYQLKNGVSSERIGHTLMRREGVVQKLLQLQMNTV
ncbi:MAG: DNA mismatch repair protein MutS, partial [Flavitalea sp.]